MKYMFLNDIEYLARKRCNLLLIIIILPLIFLFINNNTSTVVEIVNRTMGTNLNMDSYLITEMIMFIFNAVIFVFISIDVYIKDIEYQLDKFFLRLSPMKWYIKKSLTFLLTMFLIKFIQYMVLTIIISLLNKDIIIMEILKIMGNDYIYILFLQFTFLFIYIVMIILFKNKIGSLLIFSSLFIILPIDIYSFGYDIIYLGGLIIAINLIMAFIFKKGNKKIIENV